MKTITTLPPVSSRDADPRIVLRQPPGDHGIVNLGEAVLYHDQKTGRTRRVRIVLPQDVDPERGRISVYSPVGAALMGLHVGQSADWEDRHGNRRTLKVLSIEDNLEPVGYLNV
ncbi:GreA/GreB family elongation factor [Rhizomicrobium electricum]|uniref:Transcription elongation factor GreA/GreB C-terminal domain-containing protein n=1 Tax=Rhizomicrobium electricum TaxID=480070 RepID=A0ABP3PC59_9PROT|nr:GreA/GreB family elongation factor [Rhizomicrobium electricum]NIJ48751.1 regulator of nucleoside diphosphate kinase [Rhizomicrobium electricum]